MSIVDTTNRPVWASWAATFSGQDTWTDQGERNAISSIASTARGARILDVGVGAGRSTWFLQLLTPDYVGIDYTPEMVDLCKATHPQRDIRVGDARQLNFPEGSLDVVVFSSNGLDAVNHDDRLRCMTEFHRVLKPGGILLFSGLNKDGPAYRSSPWRPRLSPWRDRPLPIRLVQTGLRIPLRLGSYARSYRNWIRVRRHVEDHGSWGLAPLAAHDFGLLVHYATVPWQVGALADAGFTVETIWNESGQQVEVNSRSASVSHHFVARRSA